MHRARWIVRSLSNGWWYVLSPVGRMTIFRDWEVAVNHANREAFYAMTEVP